MSGAVPDLPERLRASRRGKANSSGLPGAGRAAAARSRKAFSCPRFHRVIEVAAGNANVFFTAMNLAAF